ncbi:hypothetical protein [Streptomyces sp. ADI97-07]|uniref:hypothetical protein n=1 Tax=Streptomyces sp. ADI97-07 TaxID=1522762 RepID=UPI000F553162|nr:hypothetical protein [Streptomyces sp. ADI97-07]
MTKGIQIDWDRGHGVFTGPISAAGTALAATYTAHTAAMPPWWAVAAAAGGMLGSHLAGVRSGATRGALILRASAWAGVGTWCSWALAVGPWSAECLGALAIGAGTLSAAMSGVRAAQHAADAHQVVEQLAEERAHLARAHRALAEEWIGRIARVCGIEGVQIVGVEMWEHGNGFTLDGVLPPGGYTWRHLQTAQNGLAGDARLPNGCGVEITEGADRGSFLANVETANQLAGEPTMYPADYSPRSMNDGLQLGVHRDGSEVAPCVRQSSGVWTGRKGSGKSNLMNVSISGQCRMVDSLTWVIDLNGGSLALPWLRAWHKAGRPGRPPIDYVADTPEKALAMAEALLRIAKARKPGYADLQIEADDDKLPVSAAVPGIIVNADEIAELYSGKARKNPTLRKAGDALLQVVELARAVACNVIAAALRATQDVIEEPQLVVQAGLKICMKSDERELAYLMGWNEKITAEDMPEPGTGVIKVLDAPARPFQAYRITPTRIAEIVVATADLQPELDDLSRKAAGEAYATRWDNTGHLFDGTVIAAAPAPAAVDQDVRPARPGWTDPTAGWGKPAAAPAPPTPGPDPIADADAAVDRIRDSIDETTRRDPALEAQARAIFEAGGLEWTPPPNPLADDATGGKREDPRKAIVLDIVTKSGPNGIGPEAIRDAIARLHPHLDAPHAATLGRWLDADPRIHKPRYGRYAVRPTDGTQP